MTGGSNKPAGEILVMRVVIINPGPALSGSSCIERPLIDDGHEVQRLDAEGGARRFAEIVQQAAAFKPRAILLGHAGSISEHPIVAEVTRLLRAELPDVWIVYGGAYASRHWREVLMQEPQIDVIVRGENAQTTPRLIWALETGRSLYELRGIAFRNNGVAVSMPPAAAVTDRDCARLARS
jgi:anaerobic magnesium-protoporphyrin IX monomethyl ester cyclase